MFLSILSLRLNNKQIKNTIELFTPFFINFNIYSG